MSAERTVALLEELIRYSEQEFLTVGQALHGIDQQITSIKQEADLLRETVQDSRFAVQLQFFGKIDLDHNAIPSSSLHIQAVLDKLDDCCDDNQNHLRKMIHQVKGMQKTDLVVRVELAHHDTLAGSYTDLARQVADLSSAIKKRADTLLLTSLQLSDSIRHGHETTHDFFSQLCQQTTTLIDQANFRLEQLRIKQSRASDLLALLTTGGSELRGHLDIVINNLQMHDIIRQQLQSVISLLHTDRISSPSDPAIHESTATLMRCHDDFFTAIENIRLQLISISNQLTGLYDSCTRLLDVDLSKNSSCSVRAKHNSHQFMTELVGFTCQGTRIESTLQALIADLSAGLAKNHRELQEIISLEADIELAAQNASVTADNVQQIQATLTVLSEQTLRDIMSTQTLLSRIVSSQNDMETQAAQLLDGYKRNCQNIESLIECLGEFDERIIPLEKIQRSNDERINDLCAQLSENIASVSPLLEQFHDNTGISAAISESIRLLNPKSDGLSPDEDSSELAQKRQEVVESAVHKRLTNDDGNKGPDLDRNLEEFGDDIELF